MITHKNLVDAVCRSIDPWACPGEDCFNKYGCRECAERLVTEYENSLRADERKKVLAEVREITKTIEADDMLARAESCGKNCHKCDGCLTRILFEQMKGEQT